MMPSTGDDGVLDFVSLFFLLVLFFFCSLQVSSPPSSVSPIPGLVDPQWKRRSDMGAIHGVDSYSFCSLAPHFFACFLLSCLIFSSSPSLLD